ncbi:MAG: hypothetical protein V4850_33290 [Myxococcota bacterium]
MLPEFLLVLTLVVLATGVRWLLRRRDAAPLYRVGDTPLVPTPTWRPAPLKERWAGDPEQPVSFGYKCSWWAIRSESPARVIEALGLREARPVAWPEGVDRAHGGRGDGPAEVFVSPPIDGWVLVVGAPADFEEAIEERLGELARVSAALDTVVQVFGTHRVVEYHAWAWADRGTIVRAFAFEGDVLVSRGAPTATEVDLEVPLELTEEDAPGEDHVMAVAGGWSLDPQTLDEHAPVGRGWIGTWP